MSEEKAQIAIRLKEFGEKNFGSMAQFAKALGIRPQELHSYLKARSKPGNILQRKLRALGCDLDWLMTGKASDATNGFQITAAEKELLAYLKNIGIDSADKAANFFDVENLAQDIAKVLREKIKKLRTGKL